MPSTSRTWQKHQQNQYYNIYIYIYIYINININMGPIWINIGLGHLAWDMGPWARARAHFFLGLGGGPWGVAHPKKKWVRARAHGPISQARCPRPILIQIGPIFIFILIYIYIYIYIVIWILSKIKTLKCGQACLRRKFLGEKTTFKNKISQNVSFWWKWLEITTFSRNCLKSSGRGRRRRRRRRRKNFPRASKSHPPRTQGQHIP